jgi:hypothetical protein
MTDKIRKTKKHKKIEKREKLKTTKNQKGWLIYYLLRLDQMFYSRWDYWTRAFLRDEIPRESIPQIQFRPSWNYMARKVQKNLKTCLDYPGYTDHNVFENFIDWILWGFNQGNSFPNINKSTDDFWYRTFNLGLFYEEPADHFAEIATEYFVGKSHGYFPTPGPVVELMVRMNFGEEPSDYHKNKSVLDPCCGTGIMLMYASNYSLNLYGVDINPLLCKIAKVNAYIYVPWLAFRPKTLTMFDKMDSWESIIEVELPSGIKIPECKLCNNREKFFLELETDHELLVSNAGFLNIRQPQISNDVVNKKLKPENISCANCYKESL